MTSPWPRFLRSFLGTFIVLLAIVAGFITLMNPYGNLPVSGGWSHVIMDQHQRYHYPSIARSGTYDSAVFGTSTGRLLEPGRLNGHFGGHFANLAMNAAVAWEQVRLARVFLKSVPSPHAVLFTLDGAWCNDTAEAEAAMSAKSFPDWLYDDNSWNDWLYVLNVNAARNSLRRVENLYGLNTPTVGSDGYAVFVPPESEYDAQKAFDHIWHGKEPFIPPTAPDHQPTEAELTAWRFPALAWLDGLLAELPNETLRIIAFMPPHVADHPAPGSPQAARVKLCKAKVAEIARRSGTHYLDFWIRSPITLDATNYWDGVHYRVPIAARIVDDIGLAVSGGQTASADFVYASPANRVLP